MTDRLDLWPTWIVEDRYNGCYSHGKWIAVARANTFEGWALLDGGMYDDDVTCSNFWGDQKDNVQLAVGNTPDAALAALYVKNGI